MECFDPIGAERTWYRSLGPGKGIRHKAYTIGRDVETDGELITGEKFAGFRELRELMAKRPEPVVRSMATKLLVYASGRPMTAADRPSVDAVVEAAKKNGYGLRSMIHAVVESEMFHRR